MRTFPALIAGRMVAEAPSFVPLINPYEGQQWAQIPECATAQVADAVAAARAAFVDGWEQASGHERAGVLERVADVIDAHADELGELEMRDSGKLRSETTGQVRFAAKVYRYYSGQARTLAGRTIPLEDPGLIDSLSYQPYGVCALLVAWNSPMQLLANKLGPALAAGNCVVVKPSEEASASVCRLAELLADADLPPGVVNVVTGRGSSVGQALIRQPEVDLVSLTGGPEAGRAVMRAAAETMAKVVLELGGRSPQLVFADADLDAAAAGVIRGILSAGGQTCVAGSRLYVEEAIARPFMDALVTRAERVRLGDPDDPATDMGPIANRPHFERVFGYLQAAADDGIKPLTGGVDAAVPSGLFVAPTIFWDAPPRHPVACEEIFGPVLSAWPFTGEGAAIGAANDTPQGLAAGVWTSDLGKAHRVANRLRVGTVWINTYRRVDPAAPFGGVKRSGIGRERGLEGLLEYTQTRNVIWDPRVTTCGGEHPEGGPR